MCLVVQEYLPGEQCDRVLYAGFEHRGAADPARGRASGEHSRHRRATLPEVARRGSTRATVAVETPDLEPLLTHTFPIERAAEAYALVNAQPPDLVQCLLSYEDVVR